MLLKLDQLLYANLAGVVRLAKSLGVCPKRRSMEPTYIYQRRVAQAILRAEQRYEQEPKAK
jgi:hypothetical protein